MNSNRKTILVAGGDLRYGYTTAALARMHEVYAAGFTRRILPFPDVHLLESAGDTIPPCDVLVLPMPVSEDGVLVNAPFGRQNLSLTGLIPLLKPNALVLGGRFGKSAKLFQDAGMRTADYFEREELAVLNAVPTAEGALQILLEEMPRTICGSHIWVLGFGRIGTRLSRMLHALGGHVTVCARSAAERAKAEMLGCEVLPLSEMAVHAGEPEVICNTVPAKVLDEGILEHTGEEILIVDLASKPGGVDLEATQKLGRRVVWALSLPGRTAPITAGEMIAKTIFNILEEDVT